MRSIGTVTHTFGHFRRSVLLCLLLPLASLPSAAETVAIPLGQQGKAWNVETPQTGLTKDQVEAQFGAPQTTSGPVGDPPIYTWDYGQFAVYFETDRVIHSVVKRPSRLSTSLQE